MASLQPILAFLLQVGGKVLAYVMPLVVHEIIEIGKQLVAQAKDRLNETLAKPDSTIKGLVSDVKTDSSSVFAGLSSEKITAIITAIITILTTLVSLLK